MSTGQCDPSTPLRIISFFLWEERNKKGPVLILDLLGSREPHDYHVEEQGEYRNRPRQVKPEWDSPPSISLTKVGDKEEEDEHHRNDRQN